MAHKKVTLKSSASPASKVTSKRVAGKVASSTSGRNSAILKGARATMAAPRKEITREVVAAHAFGISMGQTGGSDLDNWYRAERELREGL